MNGLRGIAGPCLAATALILFFTPLLSAAGQQAFTAAATVSFNVLQVGQTELYEKSNDVNYMLKLERDADDQTGNNIILSAYVDGIKKYREPLTPEKLNTVLQIKSNGFDPKRSACITKNPDSGAYWIATFPEGTPTELDSPLGGICNKGSLFFEFGPLDLTPKLISEKDSRYKGYSIKKMPGGNEIQVTNTHNKEWNLLKQREGVITPGKTIFKKADATRKNGLKSQARIWAAVETLPAGSTTQPRLAVWFRDELVPQGLVDLFAFAYNRAKFEAAQSVHEQNWDKVKTLKAFKDTAKESVVLCFRSNEKLVADANKAKKPKIEFVKSDGSTENIEAIELVLAGRCFDAARRYKEQGTENLLKDFSLSSEKYIQLYIDPKEKLKTGTYQITFENELKDDLKAAVTAEVTDAQKAEKIIKEERRLKVLVTKPFSGIQSKKSARVLFVVNPVTELEKRDYEKQQKSQKKKLAAYDSLKDVQQSPDVAISGIKEADGIVLYVNNKLLIQELQLGSGWAPASLGRRFGFKYKSTTANDEGYIDLYIPELDPQSEAYKAFAGTNYKELLEKNVDGPGESAVKDWWGGLATATALDTPPRAYAPVREYEKICGLGSDVVEYFECKDGKWKKFSPNIEITEDEKKRKPKDQLKQIVEEKTKKKLEELKQFLKADDAVASKRNELTLENFQKESCTPRQKIYINHVNDVGLYKTPRFYTLWNNLLQVLTQDGDFLKNQVNNGKLRVRVRPLNLYTSDNAQNDERAYGYLGNLPLHPFTFGFHRLPQAAQKQPAGIITTKDGIKFQIVPMANQFVKEDKKKGAGIEVLKEYLHPVPPKGDKPLSSAYVTAYMKRVLPLIGMNDSFEDVAAVLEIRVPEKTGMKLSGYSYGGENKVPQSSRTADGKKMMNEGFLTQMECTNSTINGRDEVDPETKSTFERKEPLTKKGCINLPLEDAVKANNADLAIAKIQETTGDKALDVLKACRALHSYYYQDFGVTKELKTKPGTAKDRVVLNNLDLAKKYLYDITLCPDVESCGAAPVIQPSQLVETRLSDNRQRQLQNALAVVDRADAGAVAVNNIADAFTGIN